MSELYEIPTSTGTARMCSRCGSEIDPTGGWIRTGSVSYHPDCFPATKNHVVPDEAIALTTPVLSEIKSFIKGYSSPICHSPRHVAWGDTREWKPLERRDCGYCTPCTAKRLLGYLDQVPDGPERYRFRVEI